MAMIYLDMHVSIHNLVSNLRQQNSIAILRIGKMF